MFPGDTPYEQHWAATLGPGCPVNVSSDHAVAARRRPRRCAAALRRRGRTDRRPWTWSPTSGPCRVIHAIGCGPLVNGEHLAHAATELPPRVLVRTYDACRVDRWDGELAAYAPETIEHSPPCGVQAGRHRHGQHRPRREQDAGQPPGDPPAAACACWRTWCSTTCPRATTS